MKKILLLTTTVLLISNCFSQVTNWAWAKNATASGLGSSANGIDCDSNGNSIIVGHFRSANITFGGITVTNGGNNNNVFVVKYNASGGALWAKSAGGANDAFGESVAVDVNGNIYITGSFSSPSITFGSFTLTNFGGSDVFVVKYNSSGSAIWAKNYGGTSNEWGYGIATDINGNVYITGAYTSSSASFGSSTLTNVGGSDVFLVKCDTNGNVLWADNAGGSIYSDGATSVSVDTSGNAYITGYYLSSPILFGSISLTNTGGTDNFFVTKYNTSGSVVWAKSAGVNDGGQGNSIKADAIGNTYITGTMGSSTMTFGSITLSNPGVFIVKYNSSGNVIWAKCAGGLSLNAKGNSISIDPQGNSYITGYFDGTTIVFGTTTLTNTNWAYDIYIAEYDSSGNPIWATSCGGTDADIASGITLDNNQNIIITGGFLSNSIAFGSTTLTNSSAGSFDAFTAKLDNLTGIEENILAENISIYPNPFIFQTTILFSEQQTNTTIKILDLIGKEIKIINFTGRQLVIEKGEMNAGVYFVQTTDEKKNITNKKIIIQ